MLVPGARPPWGRRPTPEERRATIANQRWTVLILQLALYGVLLVVALTADWSPVAWGATFGFLWTAGLVVARQVVRHRRTP